MPNALIILKPAMSGGVNQAQKKGVNYPTPFTSEAYYVKAPKDKNTIKINGVMAAEYNKDMRITRL